MATEIQFDNVDSILTCLADLSDPRSHINQLHVFSDLLVICIIAVIAGADGPQAIGVWAANNQTWLKKHLKLSNGIPPHDTLGRLLAALKPKAFQACFQNWIQSVSPLDEDTGTNQIAIDGKVLPSSHDRSKGLGPLWLVSAWAVDRSISLGQLATDEKSNEITAYSRAFRQYRNQRSGRHNRCCGMPTRDCKEDHRRRLCFGAQGKPKNTSTR